MAILVVVPPRVFLHVVFVVISLRLLEVVPMVVVGVLWMVLAVSKELAYVWVGVGVSVLKGVVVPIVVASFG